MNSELHSEILQCAVSGKLADGTPYRRLSVARTARLAGRFGVGGRRVDIAALEQGIIPERYCRNIKTLSPEDQIVLLRSRVCIVGLGGLGGTATEILARAGIGRLVLVDGDRFDESNLNRQVLSDEHLLGTSKAKAAADRVRRINSTVEVQATGDFLTAENALPLLEKADAVVDCLDNMKTRFILEDAARQMGAPMVSAAVGGMFGQITTIFPQDRGLELIYGARENVAMKGAEASLGNLPTIVSLMASLECSEVFNVLLKREHTLRNRMLIADLSNYTFETLELV